MVVGLALGQGREREIEVERGVDTMAIEGTVWLRQRLGSSGGG
jgi:hypothetical protein